MATPGGMFRLHIPGTTHAITRENAMRPLTGTTGTGPAACGPCGPTRNRDARKAGLADQRAPHRDRSFPLWHCAPEHPCGQDTKGKTAPNTRRNESCDQSRATDSFAPKQSSLADSQGQRMDFTGQAAALAAKKRTVPAAPARSPRSRQASSNLSTAPRIFTGMGQGFHAPAPGATGRPNICSGISPGLRGQTAPGACGTQDRVRPGARGTGSRRWPPQGGPGQAQRCGQINPLRRNRALRSVSGRAPKWLITSAAATHPMRPLVARGWPVANPYRNPAAN